MTDEQEVGAFISGLKESLRADVQAQRPPNLNEAIGLARVFESRSTKGQDLRVGPTSRRSNEPNRKEPALWNCTSSFPIVPPTTASSTTIRRFTPAELQQ